MHAIDSHCHLADPRLDAEISSIILSAKAKGIEKVLLSGIDPEDWQSQLRLQKKYSDFLLPCFGLHPYYIAKNTPDECEIALALLEKSIEQSFALGEMGLDFRSVHLDQGPQHQLKFFKKQLLLAQKYEKIPVLHIVRAHQEAITLLQYHRPPKGFLVHSFNSDWSKANEYLQLGGYLSIASAPLFTKNQALRDALVEIPLHKLLLESDSPDQAPPNWPDKFNSPESIFLVAESISRIKKIPVREIIEQTRLNFSQLFGSTYAPRNSQS